jgi:formylglycine-generating enzyme
VTRFLDSAIPALGLKVVGALLVAGGLALPWIAIGMDRPNGGATPSDGDVRPAMRVVPTGTFTMGSPATEEGRDGDERQHRVVIHTAFAISVTEVTQAQYQRVMGTNPSIFRGQGERPIENVSWFEAIEYCNRLSDLEGLERCYEMDGDDVTWPKGVACTGYRLPTEAEWEYAARADSAFVYAGGDDLERVAWHKGNAGSTTHRVAGHEPNGWGLYDMSGNVWEWVWDRYADYVDDGSEAGSDPTAPEAAPTGPKSGSHRVDRGGSFGAPAASLRPADRGRAEPFTRREHLGFRLARSFPSL